MATAVALGIVSLAGAANVDTLVTVGSPLTPFSQNKQNEPAIAIDANHPNVLVAGRQRQHRHGGLQRGRRHDLSVHPGRRRLRCLLLVRRREELDATHLYGLQRAELPGRRSARDPGCQPDADGPIGTLPWYFENGARLRRRSRARLRPAAGSERRFLLGERVAPVLREPELELRATTRGRAFKGVEAIGVSRTDNATAAASDDKSAWMPPVLISKQSSDDASPTRSRSGPTTLVQSVLRQRLRLLRHLRGARRRETRHTPLFGRRLARRRRHVVACTRSRRPAGEHGVRNPATAARSAPTANGTVYVFWRRHRSAQGTNGFELWHLDRRWRDLVERRGPVAGPGHPHRRLRPGAGRLEIDGIAGARDDLALARASTSRTARRPAPGRRTGS